MKFAKTSAVGPVEGLIKNRQHNFIRILGVKYLMVQLIGYLTHIFYIIFYKGLETTLLVSFDNEFIGRDQKQRRNGEACRASPTCFYSSMINLILKDACFFI